MSKPNDRAYPLYVAHQGINEGLTKRELFAAMVCQGLCRGAMIENEKAIQEQAVRALKYADALIAELNKESGDQK